MSEIIDFIINDYTTNDKLTNLLPSGGVLRLIEENNSKISGIETAKHGS
jgi:hypothetical protein